MARAFPRRTGASLPRWTILIVAVIVTVAGCGAPEKRVTPHRIDPADPCATRLHDICGHLLLYRLDHGNLPAKLEELAAEKQSEPLPPLECPASKRPYRYEPAGTSLPGQTGRIVLSDAVPAHAGLRWGVAIEEPGPGKPLISRVIALPAEEAPGKPAPATGDSPANPAKPEIPAKPKI